jgi:hypothetical protein
MKKVFALVVLAGSLSLFACESNTTNNEDANGTDSTVNVNTDVNTTTTDSTVNVTVDTTGTNGGNMSADTTNMAH